LSDYENILSVKNIVEPHAKNVYNEVSTYKILKEVAF
jgi:hypothetical protein